MTEIRPRLAAAAVALLAAAWLCASPTHAAPPFDEVNDIQWCVDQTSTAVRGAVGAYAGFVADTFDANYHSLKCKLHQHAPVTINGLAPEWQNGQGNPATLQALFGIVRGTGTSWDPYVIQNWEFPGSDKATVHAPSTSAESPAVPEHDVAFNSGITIVNTDQHFVIDRVYAHGWSGAAIRIGATLSGGGYPTVTVQGSLITDSAEGIEVFNDHASHPVQPKVRAVGNTILGAGIGVHAWSPNWGKALQTTVEGNRIDATQAGVLLGGRGGTVSSNVITSADRGIVAYGNAATLSWNTVTAPRPVHLDANGGWTSWGATTVSGNTLRGFGYEPGLSIQAYRYGTAVETWSNDIRGATNAVRMTEGTLRMNGDLLDCSDGGQYTTWCHGLFYMGSSSAQLSGVDILCHGDGVGIGWKVPASDPVVSGGSISSCSYTYARYA